MTGNNEFRVIADLHIHGRFSRATSSEMKIEKITYFAQMKGLNLVGTGDFTHPGWFNELKNNLKDPYGDGIYKPTEKGEAKIGYLITGEVSTVFTVNGKVKKIHNLILTPSLEVAAQINDRLSKYGDLSSDGRPTLNMKASELVEEVLQISSRNVVIPAHIWTPWFSLFGAFSGFDRIEDCYEDMTRHIIAIETGLSSDPPMNWRLKSLDRFVLVSNSDAHSFWPWRIGREANVFYLERMSYDEIVDAIRRKDTERFRLTIETDPAYGKYHWTGHRSCGVSLPPEKAIMLGNRCPVCGRKLTKGVEQRVEELADRPRGYRPINVPDYLHLLPLSEIISTVIGSTTPSSKRVWNVYNRLIQRFGDEYTVLIDASLNELLEATDPEIAEAIIRVREGKVKVIPGYDGVYGQIRFSHSGDEGKNRIRKQRSISEYFKND